MNKILQQIFNIIQQSEKLDTEQKDNLLKAVKDADKEFEITSFKLERTEKVKKTTAILLEETIEELEQKRKAVEKQNQELEIEGSLERVRAVAMSMHKSEDLLNVSEVLYMELCKLGFNEMRNAMINIHNDENKTFLNYDYSDEIGKSVTLLNYDSHPVMENQIKQSRAANDAFSEAVYKGKDLEEWKEFRRKYGEKDDPRIENITALYYYFYSIGNGTIGISTFSPINEEKLVLLKRFRNVFSLAYRRYSDLALAEAQAREAKIEAALERVRSRTMGMHKSEELKDVIRVVYEQFVHLNINVDHAGFVIDYIPKGDWHFWIADEQDIPSKITHPHFESVWANQFNEAKEKGAAFFATNLNFEEKNKFYNELLSYIPGLPEASKDFYLSCPGLAGLTVLFDNVSLYIENFSGIPYSDEENKILMRFGKVFQQTYTRFLDLQKAEAQAREAKIEAALERIRARSMAMHQSNELHQVVLCVSQEITNLGMNIHGTHLYRWDENDLKGLNVWFAAGDGISPNEVYWPYFKHTLFDGIEDARRKGKIFFTLLLNKREKNRLYLHLNNKTSIEIPEERKNFALEAKGAAYSLALGKNAGIAIFRFTNEPFSSEENEILQRFTNVFEQAFTRFLDLQKAEAQAREAQIEAALERVRARSLAMHHTSELQSVVDAVSQQLKNLDIDANGGAFITINNEVEKDIPIWGSSGAANYIQKVTIPFLDKPIFTQLRDAIKNRNDFFVEEYTHAEKIEFLQHLFNHSPWNLLPPKRKKELLSREGGYTRSLAVSRYTSIFIINHNGKKFSESDNQILKRFGKVFEQSYTRFLDLQKAEAQNKIIQAENERKSKELDEARELQLAMLPKQIPLHPKLDIKVYMQTATEVGGDYYDFSIHNDGSINIAIGDATGHGLKAGTLVTMMKSLFTANSSRKEIEDFFFSSNAAIKNSNLKRMMIGFAILNIKDYKARFINAAMPSLYHYRKKLGKVEEIEQHNLPLGAMAIENYKSTEISLTKGDALIMMSDGFPELHNPNGEVFGYERAYAAIQKAADKQPEEIIKSLNNETIKWIGNKDLQDDVTFVVIKVK